MKWIISTLIATISVIYPIFYYRLSKEKRDSEKKQRKIDIRPRFVPEKINITPELIAAVLLNNGGAAKIISYENLVKHSMNSNLSGTLNKEINHAESIILKYSAPSESPIHQCRIDQKIIYKDIDGNRYSQIIENENGLIKVHQPEENFDKFSLVVKLFEFLDIVPYK